MLKKMNDCLEYIEQHLDADIDMEVMARMTFTSKFHFQKMFHVLTGCTCAEYIRKRRLTRAAQELCQNGIRVIDVALKYGYESPESFSKAFRKVHGVTPSSVKTGSQLLKAFPQLSFQITLRGEYEMDYRIVEKGAWKAAGIGKTVTTVNGQNLQEVPDFWREMDQRGITYSILEDTGAEHLLGVCSAFDSSKEEFTYLIGAETDKEVRNLQHVHIPACHWAVFKAVGPVPHAVVDVWKRIYAEWFPSTGYEHAGYPEFELYTKGDLSAEDYVCEIWIPIQKK
ncbi:AraC family transcriptional regulator [Metabacillus lacus]|nr:AraC family transcriptional regulator [Metabacillus lacus]